MTPTNIKISDLVYEVDRRNPPDDAVVFSVSETHGIIPQDQLFTKAIAIDDRSKYRLIEYGDVVFNPYLLWNRAVGVCFYRDGGCVSPAYVVLRPRELNTERFLHYFFRSNAMTAAVDAIATGSVTRRRTAPLSEILSLQFRLPPIEYQKAVNSIIKIFDERINLNHRMNETIDAITRAIFRSWFVDYDPVYSKTNGVNNQLNGKIHGLFPESFQESELGKIPKGWKTGRLDDLVFLQRGFDLPKKNRIPGHYPLIAASGYNDTHSEAKVKGPGVVTGRSGRLGVVTFVQEDFWPLNTTLWVKEFRGSAPYHAYLLLHTLSLEQFNAGSAVPTLNRNHIHGIPMVIPPFRVVQCFEELLSPLFNKKFLNIDESDILSSLRDTLLPKLLSGEMYIKNAEKFLKETGL
jgi:type I restriction enzyme S subunit